MEKVEILKEQIRKQDELLELVVALAAKNIALEKEIERLVKQTNRLWEDLKEYEKDQDDDDGFDDDEDLYLAPNGCY
tara:strand:+ start:219 stop:449 length:231 start_codon:yes stop_codon:yes gene_type:complete